MKGLRAPLGSAAVALIVAIATPVWAWDPANPDDPAADAAAKDALRVLGPDRGALALVSDIRSLVSEVRDVVVASAVAPAPTRPKPPIAW
jgi:hypothetical protein